MIKTVIFLVSHPFGQRDYDRYGIQTFKANGFDIRVWDLTPFLFPVVHQSVTLTDPIDWDKLTVFQREEDFIAALDEHGAESFIFNTEVYNRNTFRIYRTISQRRIPYCVSVLNPGPVLRDVSARSYIRRFQQLTPKKLVSYVFKHIPPRCFKIRAARMVLAVGSQCSIRRPDVTSATQIVYGHNSDYDIYLRLGRDGDASSRTAVFLDNYLPFHPDNLYSGHESPVTPARYYSALTSLFDRFERASGMKVVVASHPRSNYEQRPGLFGDRQVVRGRTPELVKMTSLVMVTFSAAVNFPVLFRKPCMFLTTDELEASMYGPYIHQCASEFRKRPINIDRPGDVDLAEALRVDEAAYAWYQDAYIKTDGSEQLSNWQILCNKIKEL